MVFEILFTKEFRGNHSTFHKPDCFVSIQETEKGGRPPMKENIHRIQTPSRRILSSVFLHRNQHTGIIIAAWHRQQISAVWFRYRPDSEFQQVPLIRHKKYDILLV